jgi:flagellar basal-body rod modification protein FlgD
MSSGISPGGVLDGVTGTGQQTDSGAGSSGSGSGSLSGGLGKNQFLEILLAQLQNQNPLKPQKSGKFVDQMASLTSLEQMTQISNSLQSFQQSQKSRQFLTLLGKKVEVTTSEGNNVTGEVQSVKYGDDSTSVKIGGSSVVTEDITAISTIDGSGNGSGDGGSSS